MQIQGPKIAPTFALTLIALGLIMLVAGLMSLVPNLNDAATNFLMGVYGFLTKLAADAWNYFFGTTRNSEAKTAILAASQPPHQGSGAIPPGVVVPPPPATPGRPAAFDPAVF